MAAPAHTAIGTPAGFKMPDGYRTVVAFARSPNVAFWEQTVKPIGWDGGDLIDTTSMRNNAVRTGVPRKLKTVTPMTLQVFWDPDVNVADIDNLLNVNDAVSIYYPDGSYHDVWAALTKFEPGEHKEGDPPVATVTISPTNWDPVNNVEAKPVFTPAVGT